MLALGMGARISAWRTGSFTGFLQAYLAGRSLARGIPAMAFGLERLCGCQAQRFAEAARPHLALIASALPVMPPPLTFHQQVCKAAWQGRGCRRGPSRCQVTGVVVR